MTEYHFTTEELAIEEWRPVPEAIGKYSVSNIGRVRRDGKYIMNAIPTEKGYKSVHIRINGKDVTWRIHRLVMAVFYGPSELTVNHIDGDKTNNRFSNLEYMTQRDNVRHSIRLSLRPAAPTKQPTYQQRARGERNGISKLTDEQAKLVIKMRDQGIKYKDIAVQFGITPQAACLIAKGKNWSHLRNSMSQ